MYRQKIVSQYVRHQVRKALPSRFSLRSVRSRLLYHRNITIFPLLSRLNKEYVSTQTESAKKGNPGSEREREARTPIVHLE